MRTYILMIIFFIFQNSTNAQNIIQQNFENTLKVEYRETSIFIKGIPNNDKVTLYIFPDFFFCKTQFNFDEANSEKIKNNIEDAAVIEANPEDYFSEIYVHRKENKLTEYLIESKEIKKKFAVEEKLPKMEWELLNENKQIGGYSCEKAKTTFRGRTYEVWYTPEIPISTGPWKFNGLPGLILSVKDLMGIYSWDITSITTIHNNEFEISKYLNNKSDFTKISYKDFDEKVIKAQVERRKVQKARVNADFKFNFSTEQDKEPINEWRTQTYFEF